MNINNMMSISQIGGQQTERSGSGPPEHIQQMWEDRQAAAGSDLEVSAMGQMLGELSESDRTELKNYREQTIESIQSGDYDVDDLAAQAPDVLKKFAEENGIELTEMVENMVNTIGSGEFSGGRPDGVGGRPEGAGGYSQQADMLTTLLDMLTSEEDDSSVDNVEEITI